MSGVVGSGHIVAVPLVELGGTMVGILGDVRCLSVADLREDLSGPVKAVRGLHRIGNPHHVLASLCRRFSGLLADVAPFGLRLERLRLVEVVVLGGAVEVVLGDLAVAFVFGLGGVVCCLPFCRGDAVVRVVVGVAGGEFGLGQLGLDASLSGVGEPRPAGVVDLLELLRLPVQ